MEESAIRYSCCFTGHRPEKLKRTESEVVLLLNNAIKDAVDSGFTTFISGMSRGVDIWAAEEIIARKNNGENLKLICAPAYKGTENNWGALWKNRYTAVMEQADEIYFPAEKYTGLHLYQMRDEWMVDHSSLVIAVYDGQTGGTKNTIQYALKNSVQVILL